MRGALWEEIFASSSSRSLEVERAPSGYQDARRERPRTSRDRSDRRCRGSPDACSGDMYAGVPTVLPRCREALLGIVGRRAEVEHLEERGPARDAREEQVVGLDVAMHDPVVVRDAQHRRALCSAIAKRPRARRGAARAHDAGAPRETCRSKSSMTRYGAPVVEPTEVRDEASIGMMKRRSDARLALHACFDERTTHGRDLQARPCCRGVDRSPRRRRLRRPDRGRASSW